MYNEEIPYTETIKYDTPEAKEYLWDIGFGLQAVDGLTPSDYMVGLSRDNISGEKSYGDIGRALAGYYSGANGSAETREADVVSLRIAELLFDDSFAFNPAVLKGIHRHLFTGVFDEYPVGTYRTENIRKSEAVLEGASVNYSPAGLIADSLEYDFSREREFNYAPLPQRDRALHIMAFISSIWQIHPFREGNTRTIAVFAIKYFRQFGFTIDNKPFKEHSLYFRNALVWDNYFENKRPEFLQRFTENILLGGENDLEPTVTSGQYGTDFKKNDFER